MLILYPKKKKNKEYVFLWLFFLSAYIATFFTIFLFGFTIQQGHWFGFSVLPSTLFIFSSFMYRTLQSLKKSSKFVFQMILIAIIIYLVVHGFWFGITYSKKYAKSYSMLSMHKHLFKKIDNTVTKDSVIMSTLKFSLLIPVYTKANSFIAHGATKIPVKENANRIAMMLAIFNFSNNEIRYLYNKTYNYYKISKFGQNPPEPNIKSMICGSWKTCKNSNTLENDFYRLVQFYKRKSKRICSFLAELQTKYKLDYLLMDETHFERSNLRSSLKRCTKIIFKEGKFYFIKLFD